MPTPDQSRGRRAPGGCAWAGRLWRSSGRGSSRTRSAAAGPPGSGECPWWGNVSWKKSKYFWGEQIFCLYCIKILKSIFTYNFKIQLVGATRPLNQPRVILYLDFNADAYENVKHVKNRRPVAIKIIFGFNELAVKSSSMRTVTLCWAQNLILRKFS